MQPTPTVGRTVLYAFKDKHGTLVERPATVVRTWGAETYVNLQVLTDGTNDFHDENAAAKGLMWKTSVHQSESGEPEEHHYRYPPRV